MVGVKLKLLVDQYAYTKSNGAKLFRRHYVEIGNNRVIRKRQASESQVRRWKNKHDL